MRCGFLVFSGQCPRELFLPLYEAISFLVSLYGPPGHSQCLSDFITGHSCCYQSPQLGDLYRAWPTHVALSNCWFSPLLRTSPYGCDRPTVNLNYMTCVTSYFYVSLMYRGASVTRQYHLTVR